MRHRVETWYMQQQGPLQANSRCKFYKETGVTNLQRLDPGTSLPDTKHPGLRSSVRVEPLGPPKSPIPSMSAKYRENQGVNPQIPRRPRPTVRANPVPGYRSPGIIKFKAIDSPKMSSLREIRPSSCSAGGLNLSRGGYLLQPRLHLNNKIRFVRFVKPLLTQGNEHKCTRVGVVRWLDHKGKRYAALRTCRFECW